MFKTVIYLLTIFYFISQNNASKLAACDFNYQDPNIDWPSLQCGSPNLCGGSTQSPVNILSYKSSPTLGPLTLTGYPDNDSFLLVNYEHTLQVYAPAGYPGYFKTDYTFAQFHFHILTEELFNGDYAALVMHMVHINSNMNPPGIAVLGILWEISTDPNTWLEPIINALSSVPTDGNNITISMKGFKSIFDNLQANKKDGYVNFIGSLTTPPCTEGVDWYVALTKLTLSDAQWKALFANMNYNYRPIQRELVNVQAYVPDSAGGIGLMDYAGVWWWVWVSLMGWFFLMIK